MKEQYSVDEILSAIDELQKLKKGKKVETVLINKPISNKNSDIPSNTLQLIEEAEKTIRSKLRSE